MYEGEKHLHFLFARTKCYISLGTSVAWLVGGIGKRNIRIQVQFSGKCNYVWIVLCSCKALVWFNHLAGIVYRFLKWQMYRYWHTGISRSGTLFTAHCILPNIFFAMSYPILYIKLKDNVNKSILRICVLHEHTIPCNRSVLVLYIIYIWYIYLSNLNLYFIKIFNINYAKYRLHIKLQNFVGCNVGISIIYINMCRKWYE